MTKEELINFINSIDFEIVTCMTLTYIKKKPTRYMSEDEKYNSEPKTITFQKDYESLINERNNWTERRIEGLYAELREIREREERTNGNN